MNEAQFKNKIIQQFKADNHYIFKYPAGMRGGGVPDLIGCVSGTFYGIEAKVIDVPVRNDTLIYPFKNLTQLQFANIYHIAHSKGQGIVVTLINPDKIVLLLNVNMLLKYGEVSFNGYKFINFNEMSFTKNYETIRNLSFSKEKILFFLKNDINYKEGKKIIETIKEQKCLSITKLTNK